jgi:hypothetical protein
MKQGKIARRKGPADSRRLTKKPSTSLATRSYTYNLT